MNNNINMEKISLSENLFQYLFLKDKNGELNSIYVCINNENKKALVLDTAFQELAREVRIDLDDQGIKPEIVILSHYHPDHTAGVQAFKDCQIYCSEFYQNNFENCQRWSPDLTFIPPNHVMKDGDTLNFGSTHFKFYSAPGHSQCSILTLINNNILHIGDLLMFSADGRLTLPYLSIDGDFKEYMNSLEKVKSIQFNTLVLPHGRVLNNKEKINHFIDECLHYLSRVLTSKGTLPLSLCLKNNISNYTHTEFHENNLMILI